MYQQFQDLEQLMTAIRSDRSNKGAGATTANRFPVRFVLFDNFDDCSRFVDMLFMMGNITLSRIDDWLDPDYPDTLLTHSCLAEYIHNVIKQSENKYKIIIPFSEMARFYNNKSEHEEFNALIQTIRGYESNREDFARQARVYIPIVGQEGKMQKFRDDSQSFIWYLHNHVEQCNYRLILTNGTTYGVKGLEQYHIVQSLKDFLTYWQKNDKSKKHIISLSPTIYAHAHYAQPDNAFSFSTCQNTYDFLTDGLNLSDLCHIPYDVEEENYWKQLATNIDISNFRFDKFCNEKFGIHSLENKEVFYQQWFEHKEPFMHWLLAKYYVHKFCDKGYICRVLRHLEGYSNTAFIKELSLLIFREKEPNQDDIEERCIGLNMAAKYQVELPGEVQAHIVNCIQDIVNHNGILSAIPYVSNLSRAEKRLVIQWYKEKLITQEQLYTIYSDLYYYLQSINSVSTHEAWVLDYIQYYKEAKIRNDYLPQIRDYILTKNKNYTTHHEWSFQFDYTRTILSQRTDIDLYCWIDGLGIDWIPYILEIVQEMETENYFVNEVYIARALLPSTTDNNKHDIESISGKEDILFKIGDLDKVAHEYRPYPDYIIDDLKIIRTAILTMLQEHPCMKIAIVADHGISYLPQLCHGKHLQGFTPDHCGRCAKSDGKENIVQDDSYLILPDQKKYIVALKHESLINKVKEGTGAHGGATPEEELVPIIIISNHKEQAKWTAKQITFNLTEANPQFEVEIQSCDEYTIPIITYNGKEYILHKDETYYTSERINLVADIEEITLHIGMQKQVFHVNVQLAVQENNLFNF